MNLMRTGEELYPVLRGRVLAYWMTTLAVAFENAAGAMWVFLPAIPPFAHVHASRAFEQYISTTLTHLGYPQYFKFIHGSWQLACAAALIAPRLSRVKEWAYAGAFFTYSSAIVSHWIVGDGPDGPAIVFAALTVTSSLLRPPARRLAESPSGTPTTAASWVATAVTLALLLLLSLAWLPQTRT